MVNPDRLIRRAPDPSTHRTSAETPAAETPTIHDLLSLQRVIGNQAVQRRLRSGEPLGKGGQAQGNQALQCTARAQVARLTEAGTDVPLDQTTSLDGSRLAQPVQASATSDLRIQRKKSLGPLSAAEVRQARAWYAGRTARYTPAIIKQIQERVGAEVDGLIGPETIQAVARHQQTRPPMAVDGIAGPRTLPDLFPHGLADKESVGAYVKGGKGIQATWATFATADERATAYGEAANERLAAIGVPAMTIVVNDSDEAGDFDFEPWTMGIGRKPFASATISDKDAADLSATAYHEARHAEQWFSMARLLAGKGRSAARIATDMVIPPGIAAQATTKPLKPGSMEALIAQGWFDSVYGGNREARRVILEGAVAAFKARNAAKKAFEQDPSEANRAKLERAEAAFKKANATYENLAEEADAFRVGNDVTDTYGTP